MDTSSSLTSVGSSSSASYFIGHLFGRIGIGNNTMMSHKRKLEGADVEPSSSKLSRPVPICNECEQRDSKYRCPTCYARYCSKDCYQMHKAHCEEEEPSSSQPGASTSAANNNNARPKYECAFPTEDTVPLEKLMAVKEDSRVNAMLENPTLRALIKKIDETQDPKTSFSEVMQHPEFCAFSNLVLQIIGLRDNE